MFINEYVIDESSYFKKKGGGLAFMLINVHGGGMTY